MSGGKRGMKKKKNVTRAPEERVDFKKKGGSSGRKTKERTKGRRERASLDQRKSLEEKAEGASQ